MELLIPQERNSLTEPTKPNKFRRNKFDVVGLTNEYFASEEILFGGKITTPNVKRSVKQETETFISDHIAEISNLKKKKTATKSLKKELKDVAEKNAALVKSLDDKNSEISELKRSVNSLNDVLNSIPIDELRCNSSIASTKILELSKKNRQLRVELETTRNRCNKKDQQIRKLQQDIKDSQEKNGPDEDAAKSTSSSVTELQGKLSTMQHKFYEMRNRNIELQNQLKTAHKCIQQEIGDNVNINQVINSSASHPTWRGRAQQILHLQQKLKELKEKLDHYEKAPTTARSDTASEFCKSNLTLDNDVHNLNDSATSFDRFNPTVRKTEIQHRAKVEKLEKELTILKQQLDEQRSKTLALKVRNKTLNDEIAEHKMRLLTLTQETDCYQDKCMESVHERLNIQKNHFDMLLKEMRYELEEAIKQKEEAERNLEKLQHKFDNLEDVLGGRDIHVEKLEAVIKKLESDMEALVGGFLFSCRDMRTNDFSTLLDTLENEKNHLCTLNKTLNERIELERNKNDGLNELLAKHKVRISRLEAKIRELERELDMLTERKKRSTRIAEYSNSVNNINSSFTGRSYIFENSSMTSLKNKPSCNDISLQQSICDLKHDLEYSNEKIALLEDKLTHMKEEKEKDLTTFEEIIGNTKQRVVKALKEHNVSPTYIENGGFEVL